MVGRDIGILVLRLGAGSLILFLHGLPKLMSFTEKMDSFPDPFVEPFGFGIGSAASMSLVIFAEFFCSCAVILGLWTRWATVPLITTMGVAGFIFHANDPWSVKERALLFFVLFLGLFFLNSGRYSLDRLIAKL